VFEPYPKNVKLYEEIFKEHKKCMGLRLFRKDLKNLQYSKVFRNCKLEIKALEGRS